MTVLKQFPPTHSPKLPKSSLTKRPRTAPTSEQHVPARTSVAASTYFMNMSALRPGLGLQRTCTVDHTRVPKGLQTHVVDWEVFSPISSPGSVITNYKPQLLWSTPAYPHKAAKVTQRCHTLWTEDLTSLLGNRSAWRQRRPSSNPRGLCNPKQVHHPGEGTGKTRLRAADTQGSTWQSRSEGQG